MAIDSNPSCQPSQLFKEPLAIVVCQEMKTKGMSGENRTSQIKCIPLNKKVKSYLVPSFRLLNMWDHSIHIWVSEANQKNTEMDGF